LRAKPAGFVTASLTNKEDVLANEITIFKDRVRIDVQTSTPGLPFEKAGKNKNIMKYNEQEFYVISKEDLITSKK